MNQVTLKCQLKVDGHNMGGYRRRPCPTCGVVEDRSRRGKKRWATRRVGLRVSYRMT